MSELKVAVIVDDGAAQKFGIDALDELYGCDEITVFSCSNTRFHRKLLRHAFYYALNFVSLRNSYTRYVPIQRTRKRIAEIVDFESAPDGAWQMLPSPIIEKLRSSNFDVIIKLGMGLLRVPPPEALPVSILSWHHGDPDQFRGRPAGFWEMVRRTPVMGQIVQILSNKLDGGAVVAFAETKVYPHSYRATVIESYRHSHLLINEAVRNTLAGKALSKGSAGKNYRLPSNLTVARFAWRTLVALGRRITYGAFYEKRWGVSVAPLGAGEAAGIPSWERFPPTATWQSLEVPSDYLFLADPFFSRHPPGIIVEGLSRRSALGEILLIGQGGPQRLSRGSLHFSYPATVDYEGEQLVIPEMAQWGEQRCFRIGKDRLEDVGGVEVEGRPSLIDPTFIEHDGQVYLFANEEKLGATALQLWSAKSLKGPFHLHPFSPVHISPLGGRMAGALLRTEELLIRFGQDFSRDYGDGICAFEVVTLNPSEYRERSIGRVRFTDRRGPHTLNFQGEQMVFDWYQSRFSTRAGVRRVMARLKRKRQS